MRDDATLEAFRLADSFLPVGTNSISSGIEQFVQEGRIENLDDLRAVLEAYLRNQVGTADLVALRAAHEAARDDDVAAVRAADRRLTAVTLPAEFREAATQSGARLLSLQRDLRSDPLLDAYAAAVDDGTAPGNHPVVLGAVAGRAGIAEREACLVYCHGFLTGLLGAAQRLLSVGHTGVQRALDRLRPTVRAAVDASDARTLDDLTSFTPLAEVLSADHERADRRLFLS
ncbi:urease accessory protein UreF [Halobellus ruber]|uniref:Urease accessory protein UreF n=1 Tax=Halobellus ruber TaxID=2761102 RepID=A0A7J9SJ37_9EURY|nr:urease accessory UreF family protein [Halobellus ruber]MBB6646036.1 urease accessory protein UreF [Halobellus ruber]